MISTSALSDDPKYAKLKGAIAVKKQKKDAEDALKLAEKALADYKKTLVAASAPKRTRKPLLPTKGKSYILIRYIKSGTDSAPMTWRSYGLVKVTSIDDDKVTYTINRGSNSGISRSIKLSDIPKFAKFKLPTPK